MTPSLLALAIALFFSPTLDALPSAQADSTLDWDSTRALYDAGKVDEAFQNLLHHPENNASYYYNLGTMALRLHQPGLAVAYLEKSNRIQPRDRDATYNLRLARSSLGKLIGQERLDPATSAVEWFSDLASFDEVRTFLGAATLFFLLYWFRAYRKTRKLVSPLATPAGAVCLFFFALSLGFYLIELSTSAHPAAIALQRESIKSGPGDGFADLGVTDVGVKVRETGTRAKTPEGIAWLQIRFSAENVGWIPANSILEL